MIKDAKGFIQRLWVIQSLLVLLFSIFAIIFLPAWRLELLAKIVVPIVGVIFAQGAAASIGPEVKRAIEAKSNIEMERAKRNPR